MHTELWKKMSNSLSYCSFNSWHGLPIRQRSRLDRCNLALIYEYKCQTDTTGMGRHSWTDYTSLATVQHVEGPASNTSRICSLECTADKGKFDGLKWVALIDLVEYQVTLLVQDDGFPSLWAAWHYRLAYNLRTPLNITELAQQSCSRAASMSIRSKGRLPENMVRQRPSLS
jgi:hypothetical protein